MKKSLRLGITCIILISSLFFCSIVSAQDNNVISPVSIGDANVISPVSGDYTGVPSPFSPDNSSPQNPFDVGSSSVMSPVSTEQVNVLNDIQASLVQGETSRVYRVSLNCPGTVRLTSSYGSRYNVYAKKTTPYSSCPSASSILYNHDKAAYGYSGSAVMTLDSGVWCLMVYGYQGSGSYTLRVSSVCSNPTPIPTPTPTQTPSPCGIYRSDTRQGFLNQGQAAVYGYSIPSDGRSKIEWSMTAAGSGGGTTPIIAASAGQVEAQASAAGSPVFDLYIFKDCNPKNSRCTTSYYSYGPNSYVSVAPPSSGSIYYAMVYARTGSGTYTLNMHSYKCTGDTPIIMSAASAGTGTGTSEDTRSGSEVSAPSAEFAVSEGAA